MKLRTILLAGAAFLLGAVLAAQAQLPGVNSTLQTVFTYMYEASTNKPTYTSVMSVAQAVPASAQDICFLTGSATKTIRVRRVTFAGLANAVITEPVMLFKRTAQPPSGNGTSVAYTPIAYDTSMPAATALTDVYTSNPTYSLTGSAVADLFYTYGNYTTGVGSNTLTYEFGKYAAPVILRGTAQNLTVNLGGISLTAANITCSFEWTEYTDTNG